MLKDIFVIDIETVPQVPEYDALPIYWQELWQDKVAKTMPEDMAITDTYTRRAGILAEFGKIICISTAIFSETANKTMGLRIKSLYGDDEKLLLKEFIGLCQKMYEHNEYFQFAGHNIKEFDIPYICRRLIINGIAVPSYLNYQDKKPWEVKMFDTLNWWKFGDYKNYTSLHLLATVLGIPTSKSDMDGSMVQHVYYKERDLQRIVTYCQKDVIVTANVILRFKNMGLLEEEAITVVT